MIAQHCQEPGCNGIIHNGVCPSCGAFADDSATPPPPSGNGGNGHTATPSSKSSRSSSVSARPSSIAAVVGAVGSSHRSHHVGLSLSTRRSLGAGLVQLEVQPDLEPLKMVKPDMRIPEAQRLCSNPKCVDEKGNPTQLHLDKGFCPKCRSRYSFLSVPTGTVISGQYEVKGPIAMGGCGFIYLGWDLNVERYVVIKGLINSMDAAAMANAVKEKRFLADLRDPNIVDIVNFVAHDGAQYIVMEFVNGVTLKEIRKAKGPLPVQHAIAYTLGMLPAFEFLHSRKVVYCDFKIENAMVQKDRLRLIDLGGARRIDDLDSDMFLTIGYSAPEADQNVSFSSDLYTVGRTLAVLLMDFDFRGQFRHSLPTPQEQGLFARYESLYRFLLRSTAQNPDDRFQSAQEMSVQLEGVLREIVAIESATPKPAESICFGLDIRAGTSAVGHELLPTIRIARSDSGRGVVESALLLNDPLRQKELLQHAHTIHPDSIEAPLRLADVCIGLGDFRTATTLLEELARQDPFDWRIIWMRGRSLLAQQQYKDSYQYFDAVYSELPGELAPKLAVAVVAEMTGQYDNAIRLYDLVSKVDPGYTSASFGLARCLVAQNDRQAAVEAFARVPAASIAHVPALMQQVRTLIQAHPNPPSRDDLVQAAKTLEAVSGAGFDKSRLQADLLLTAIRLLESHKLQTASGVSLLGQPLDQIDALRTAAEHALRDCARYVTDRAKVLALIDEANSVRPRTRF